MADIFSPDVRSRMMAGIRGKNTKPEVALRSGLHRVGFRFRLKSKWKLLGKPDIVLPKWRVVVFFHGCFWHGHACPLYRLPATRTDFWRKKIEGNRARDTLILPKLIEAGWRVAVVRECAVRGASKRPWADVCVELASWIRGGQPGVIEMSGPNCQTILA
jgi:DNA mismatch endonuclease (patch repair protein)